MLERVFTSLGGSGSGGGGAQVKSGRRAWLPAIGMAALVTGAVTLGSAFLPDRWVATVVGLLFFGATWVTVWRRDDETVIRHGLAFGGLVLPGRIDWKTIGREALRALGWALALAAVCFIPFFLGFRAWAHWVWHVQHPFVLPMPTARIGSEVAAQLLIVALPEEAFYRGYLQTRLDDAWPGRVRLLGAQVGPSVIVTSAVFALGHYATIHDPARLAVFFPSLVFGWLRARTGGVGAPLAFHALCNLFSESLMRGYGLG
jgi:membrane protease YdiL (CAAX protease family)